MKKITIPKEEYLKLKKVEAKFSKIMREFKKEAKKLDLNKVKIDS